MWAINVSRQDALEGGGGKEGQQRKQEQEEATVASQIKFAFQIRRSSSARFVDSNWRRVQAESKHLVGLSPPPPPATSGPKSIDSRKKYTKKMEAGTLLGQVDELLRQGTVAFAARLAYKSK